MRLATWNVNSLSARIDFVLDFLASRAPDVVCVQELKLTDEAFPHDVLHDAGFVARTFGQARWNGVGVLVRRTLDPEPRVVATGLAGHEEMGARVITVEAAGMSITSAYVPNGKTVAHPDYRAKVAWLEAFVDLVERSVDVSRPAVVAGDFNVCPTDRDSWNPEAFAGQIFHTEAERAPIARLEALGWADLFRVKNPDLRSFSWWDYRAGAFHKKEGLRIDLVYGSPAILARTREVRIDRDFRKKREGRTPSDHAPVIVELDD